MAKFLSVQRRIILGLVTLFFTILIRLTSVSFGNNLHTTRNWLVVSDRGSLRQLAIRFSKQRSGLGRFMPFRMGWQNSLVATAYLLRIANFPPFIMLEDLDIYKSEILSQSAYQITPHTSSCDSDSDSDSDSDGDGGGCGGCGGDGDGFC